MVPNVSDKGSPVRTSSWYRIYCLGSQSEESRIIPRNPGICKGRVRVGRDGHWMPSILGQTAIHTWTMLDGSLSVKTDSNCYSCDAVPDHLDFTVPQLTSHPCTWDRSSSQSPFLDLSLGTWYSFISKQKAFSHYIPSIPPLGWVKSKH